MVFGGVQTAERFTPATKPRYDVLASQRSMVGAIGVGMSKLPADGVRGGALPNGHPMAGEWTVAVVGPHYAAALIAIGLQRAAIGNLTVGMAVGASCRIDLIYFDNGYGDLRA